MTAIEELPDSCIENLDELEKIDDYRNPGVCYRCFSAENTVRIYSVFENIIICIDCCDKEVKHKLYDKHLSEFFLACRRGVEYVPPGILPDL